MNVRTLCKIVGLTGLMVVFLAVDAVAQDATPQQTPADPAAQQAPAEASPQEATATAPAQEQPSAGQEDPGGPALVLDLDGASLRTVIDLLARRLKLNYIIDPRVEGNVTIHTYGEIRSIEIRSVLETILRINGASMVKVGDIYRIVPAADVANLPISPLVNPNVNQLPRGEELVLNLVFLKYATVKEIEEVIRPFMGQGASVTSFAPANLLMILDNARNMRRTMELVALFDSDAFATQRVRLYEVKNGKPSEIASELEKVFKGIAFSDESSSVAFIPIDRINTILAVAPNPGVFDEVGKWVQKLDVSVKLTAGSLNNYVYRVKYGDAWMLSQSIMQLYTGVPVGLGFGYGGMGGMGGMGGYGGMGGFGGGYGGFGGGMGGYGGFGGMGGFGAMGGLGRQSVGNRGLGASGGLGAGGLGGASGAIGGGIGAGQNPTATAGYGAGMGNLAGGFLGMGLGFGAALSPTGERIPHVIPNMIDNSLLIQATPQEYDQIVNLLDQIDIPPRQVLIEAKIYEVSLSGAFAAGVQAFLNRVGDSTINPPTSGGGDDDDDGESPGNVARRALAIATSGSGVAMTAGMLVGRSRELLAVLTATEDNRLTKVVAAPSLIATDSIPATITVGSEVPILTSQAASAVQQGGTSQFAQTIQNRQAGTTLAITARVTPSGVVTMLINQDVSTPLAPSGTGIQSPSFSNRTVNTQITVQDGDTIAIGGIIEERELESSGGVPYLNRIPVLGAAFGNKTRSTSRTELVVFLTPRVIYDTNQIMDATEELKGKMDRVMRLIRNSSDRF